MTVSQYIEPGVLVLQWKRSKCLYVNETEDGQNIQGLMMDD